MAECLRVTKCLKTLKMCLPKRRWETLFSTSTKKYANRDQPVVAMCGVWTSHNTKHQVCMEGLLNGRGQSGAEDAGKAVKVDGKKLLGKSSFFCSNFMKQNVCCNCLY